MVGHLLKKGLIRGMVIAIGGSTLSGSVSIAAVSTQQFYRVKDLGTLGGSQSYANAINNAGQIVGYSETSSLGTHAVLWYRGNKTDLTPSGGTSRAYGINSNGKVAGEILTVLPSHKEVYNAFTWDNGKRTDLGTISPVPFLTRSVAAINKAGQVAGTSVFSPSSDFHATLWDNGKRIDLGILTRSAIGKTSYGYGINNAGKVVGTSFYGSAGTGFRAVVWENGKKTDLGDGYAYGINNLDQVVGASSSSNNFAVHAVLWDKGNKIDLGTLGSIDSYANAINDLGQVVGKNGNIHGAYHALLWNKGSIKDLNNLIPPNSGWELIEATSINDKGQIVGYGKINGQTHAFLLTPVRLTQ